MGKAISLAGGGRKSLGHENTQWWKKGEKHLEEIVTRHGREVLWQCRYEEEKVEEKLRVGGRKELWVGVEVRWERSGSITIFFSCCWDTSWIEEHTFEKQIKDGKKRKRTKIGVTTNMKGSRKMMLTWQIYLSKLKGRDHGKNWRAGKTGGNCKRGEELRGKRIKYQEDKYLSQREGKPWAEDKQVKNSLCYGHFVLFPSWPRNQIRLCAHFCQIIIMKFLCVYIKG